MNTSDKKCKNSLKTEFTNLDLKAFCEAMAFIFREGFGTASEKVASGYAGLSIRKGTAKVDKINRIDINLPKDAAFDTCSLKQDLQDEIKSVE